MPFAIGESALQPVALTTRQVPNLLVVGRQGCGKTSALAAIGQAITARLSPEQAQITIIDPKTSLIGRIPGAHLRAYAYTPDDIDRVLDELAGMIRDRLPPSGLTQEELLTRPALERPAPFRPDRRRTGIAAQWSGGQAGRHRAAVEPDRTRP